MISADFRTNEVPNLQDAFKKFIVENHGSLLT